MKRRDVQLERLFAAARGAPREIIEPMPADLQARILARWRPGDAAEDALQSLLRLCRRALVCAAMVMVLSIAWALGDPSAETWNDLAVANYELRVDVMP